MAHPEVLVGGAALAGVQQPSIRVRHALAKTSTAQFTLIGRLSALSVPAFGDSVSINDGAGTTVFAGFVRSADATIADSDSFLDRVDVRCQGQNDNLRYRIITGPEGVDVVEADHGADQFSQLVALLTGYTGATDLDADSIAIRTDLRYRVAGAVLRELAVANDAILHVTTGREIRLFKRENLSASGLGRLGLADVHRIGLFRDPRKTRSRQFLRYGQAVARRTIPGDGSARAFPVVAALDPLDYYADGAAASAFGAAGDRGLRFREDTDVDVGADHVEFFGGAAADAATSLYVGSEELDGDSWAMDLIRADAAMRLRASADLTGAAAYGLLLRHEVSGDTWASDDAAVGSGGAPVRDDSADINLPHAAFEAGFATDTRVYFISARSSDRGLALAYNSTTGSAVSADNVQFNFGLTNANGAAFAGGDRVWIVRQVSLQLPRAYRHSLANGGDSLESFELTNFPGNAQPEGACTDGTTLWALNNTNDTLSAYRLSDGSRQSGKDIALGSGDWRGCFANDDAIWASDNTSRWSRAYSVLDQTRLAALDFDNDDPAELGTEDIRAIAGAGSSLWLYSDDESRGYHYTTANRQLTWTFTNAERDAIVTRAGEDAEFRVAVVDTGVPGADFENAGFAPVPLDVQSVMQVTLNGARESLGEAEVWHFDRARQKLIQSAGAAVLTAADSLVVDYTARVVIQAEDSTAAVTRDDFADLPTGEGLGFADALQIARAFLDRFGPLTDRVSISVRNNPELASVAETLQLSMTMLRDIGLADAADADRWLIYDAALRWDGEVPLQRIECQRGEFRERSVDWWREREGGAQQ